MKIRSISTSNRWGAAFIVLLTGSVVSLSATAAYSVNAGTLTYSGAMNGKVHFDNAECGVLGGTFITFDAPGTKNGVPMNVPYRIVVNFLPDGKPQGIIFNLHGDDVFMRIRHKTPITGVRVTHDDGTWGLVFDGARVGDTTFYKDAKTVKQLANSKQKIVSLSGTLLCTEML